MPLSEPAPRKAIHRRSIVIDGYQRDDGLWDIEGHLTDVKTYGFDSRWRGRVEPGTPVHEMWVRITIDDRMEIKACEASTEHHPFPTCTEITPNFAALAGVRIGPGWMRAVRQRTGGTKGCTHIVEMLAQVGTAAYQTLVAKRSSDDEKEGAEAKPKKRPPIIDQCHALRSDGPIVRELWPEYATGEADSKHGSEMQSARSPD